MTTYLVFTRIVTKDQSQMDEYARTVGPTFKGHAATPLAAYGAQEILEGEPHEGMVILSFPDKAAAIGWYDGPGYREVREHRFKGADYQVTMVEGL
ncbi:DUF1330 domain-containing protein [Sphingomonas solaris]|uniref:DUF1330 domain-containing protein n=1 Tax=Alterirhizorhabdus solaris TaxID=2529389 RepID=A0A558QV06_9SPHN|nr:DUF1330 domain-containing protein [Sphingomonas solaris]TVV70948.1 DUF1330 domain-containing protein [Sphingomonas solaris]